MQRSKSKIRRWRSTTCWARGRDCVRVSAWRSDGATSTSTRSTIHVSKQVRSGKEGPTKSGKPRDVPIGGTLGAELAAWREGNVSVADNALVCPPPVRMKKTGKPGKAWGKYLGPKSVDEAWSRRSRRAELEEADVYDYGRSTFGTIMGLDPAVSVWRLQSIMGHADIKTTERYVRCATRRWRRRSYGRWVNSSVTSGVESGTSRS